MVNTGLANMYSVDRVVTMRMTSSNEYDIDATKGEGGVVLRVGVGLTSRHSYCDLSSKRLYLK